MAAEWYSFIDVVLELGRVYIRYNGIRLRSHFIIHPGRGNSCFDLHRSRGESEGGTFDRSIQQEAGSGQGMRKNLLPPSKFNCKYTTSTLITIVVVNVRFWAMPLTPGGPRG